MTYSRPCGVSVAACGAQTCRCVSVDGEPVIGPQEAVQRFACDHCNDLCDYCGTTPRVCGRDFPCCCTHDNPLQTAHNQSREGA